MLFLIYMAIYINRKIFYYLATAAYMLVVEIVIVIYWKSKVKLL